MPSLEAMPAYASKQGLFCHTLVMELVDQGLNDWFNIVPEEHSNTIVYKLTKILLENLKGCHIPVKNQTRIPSIATAACKELQRTMGPKGALTITLLLENNDDYQIIAKTLQGHLLTVEKSIGEVLRDCFRAFITCCAVLPEDEEDDEDEVIVFDRAWFQHDNHSDTQPLCSAQISQ